MPKRKGNILIWCTCANACLLLFAKESRGCKALDDPFLCRPFTEDHGAFPPHGVPEMYLMVTTPLPSCVAYIKATKKQRELVTFDWRHTYDKGNLVTWCFKPSQPQRVISGLRETFVKRYILERTSKAEIRLEEQSEKVQRCQENLCNEIQLNGPWRQKQTQEQTKKKKRSGQAQLVSVKDINRNIPTTWRWGREDYH